MYAGCCRATRPLSFEAELVLGHMTAKYLNSVNYNAEPEHVYSRFVIEIGLINHYITANLELH